MTENEIGSIIVPCAIKVHRALGPGLLEKCYQICLKHELEKNGLIVESEVPIKILYDNMQLDAGYRIDLLIDKKVVVELKSVAAIENIHFAQTLTYLKHGNFRLGYLLNFNVVLMREGIHRIVNNL